MDPETGDDEYGLRIAGNPSSQSIGVAYDEESAGLIGSEPSDEKQPEKDPKSSEEPPPSMTWVQKAMFGLPQLNCNFGNALLNSWLTYYYLPPGATPSETLMPAALFGTLFLVGRLFNAVCDPFFGWVSDHSSLRLGRRIPFMLFGAPLLATSFAALFFPPYPGRNSIDNTVYFCFVFAGFNIMNSFTTSPYTALLPELSGNKRERVHMATFSGLFSLLGNLVAAAIGPFVSLYKDGLTFMGIEFHSGLQVVALFSAFLHIIGFWLPLLFLKEKPRVVRKRTNLFKEMYIAFRNPAFVSLIGVSCLLPMGVILVTTGLPYLCTQIMERYPEEPGLVRPDQGEVWVGILSGLLVGGALVWFPFIGKIVQKFGKKRVMLISGCIMSLLIISISVVKFFPDPAVPTLIGVIFLSLPAAISFVLPPAIYGDVVDFDEQRTGVRREGIYAGSQAFCNKCAMALASAIIVYLLALGSSRDESLGISLVFVVAGLIVGLGTAMFATHPIKV